MAKVGEEKRERDPVLAILGLHPSAESQDYLQTKKQFQLHSLVTEQRHKATWSLSETLATDVKAGLDQLFTVDQV